MTKAERAWLIKGLELATKHVCCYCASGKRVVCRDSAGWMHIMGQGRKSQHCDAWAIRNRISGERAELRERAKVKRGAT